MRHGNESVTRSGNVHGRREVRGSSTTPFVTAFLTVFLPTLLIALLLPGLAPGIGFEGITRDSFPVFNQPRMLPADQAEARGVVLPRDAVIGVVLGGEAKAYPIAVMGYHELGNDTLAGVPIAVSW